MTSVSLDELLEHAPWVRRLATKLVRDAAAADDLAQEVWVTAMRGAPPTLRNPKAWLASVARSLAFTDARTRQRRTAREQSRGPEDDAPAADEVVAEAELERSVAARVLALPEPYRTVLLMRFYRDLKPAQIARSLGRPVATVKVQLQRGLEKLREGLDREHGGSAKWCGLLAPLLLRRSPNAALATGVVAWSVLFGAGLWLVQRSERESRLAPAAVLPAAEAPAIAVATDTAALVSSADRREAESQPSRAVKTAPAAPTARWREHERMALRGRLVGLEGSPLAAVQLEIADPGRLRMSDETRTALVADSFWLPVPRELRNPRALDAQRMEPFLAEHFDDPTDARALLVGLPLEPEFVRTDWAGEFRMSARSPLAEPVARGAGLQVVGRLADDRSQEPVVRVWVAAPTRRLVVRCVSPSGVPLAHLKVSLEASTRLNVVDPVARVATSVENGELAFDDAPACEIRLSTRSLLGEIEARFEPPAPGALWSVVFVASMEPRARTLVGRALRPDGEPARHGRVFFSNGQASVRADGSFELSFSDLGKAGWLALVEPGFDPLVLEDVSARFSTSSTRWDMGELSLPSSQNVLEGVVLDGEGRPVANTQVSLSNPTRAPTQEGPESLEALAGGFLLGGVRTDESGRFELRGLLQREYELSVRIDGDGVRAGPFAAGSRALVLRPGPR